MTDQIRTQLIVEAVAKNFDKLNAAVAKTGQTVSAANTRVATTTGAVTGSNTGLTSSIGGVVKGLGALAVSLYAVEKAYNITKGAADKWSKDGADGFAKMEASWTKAFGVLLQVPIAGKGVIDWVDDGVAALGRQMEANAAFVVSTASAIGIISAEETAHMDAALAADEHATKIDKLRKAHEKAFEPATNLAKVYQDLAGTVLNNAAMENNKHKGNMIGVPMTYNPGVPSGMNSHPGMATQTNVALSIQVNASEVLTAAQAERIGQQVAGGVYTQFRRMGLQI